MTRAEEIAKLDLEQAKRNFEIETDSGRFDEPPATIFDRLGICKNCPDYDVLYGVHYIKYWCKKTMGYWNLNMAYCKENEIIARDAMNGWNGVTEQYIDDMSLKVLLAYCNIYGIDHDQERWLDDDYPDKEDELKVKLKDIMCK